MKSKKFSAALFAIGFLALVGCSEDSAPLDTEDAAKFSILANDLAGETSQDVVIVSGNEFTFQKNNSPNSNTNQTDEELIRGTRITIPLFDTDPIDLRVGRWGTVAFSLQRAFESESCGEPLTDAQIDQILALAEESVTNLEVAGGFDGEPLEIMPNFRPQAIITFDDGEGNCLFNLPWRLYINPQRPGEYSLTFSFTGGDFERSVNWVRP